MKSKVLKGVSIFCLSMGLGFVMGNGSEKYSLYELKNLYSYFQSYEGCWPNALEKTKEAVSVMLADDNYEPENEDMMAVNAFCCSCNYYCIDLFVRSKFYDETKHAECLKNLFRLSYKMACMFEIEPEEAVKMEQYKDLMEQQFKNDKNLLNVVNATPFSELAMLAASIICRNVDWGD